jgi:hypothetical protein
MEYGYALPAILNGLIPSVAKPSLTLRGSTANSGYFFSKNLLAGESTAIRIFSSVDLWL